MDDYEFLHFLSQYNYWSTRIYAWKSLRDRFAPDYKEWLQKRNQQLSSENNNNDMPDVKYNETKVQTPEATTSDEKLNPSLTPDNYFQQFLGVFVGITVCLSAKAS